jgi:Flp pilus assembly protein TadD
VNLAQDGHSGNLEVEANRPVVDVEQVTASEFAPDNTRYAYVYAIALNSIGAGASAMELLENTHKRHPTDRDTLLALVSISRDTGDFATALSHARELVALYPADMQLRMLVLDLEKRQAH